MTAGAAVDKRDTRDTLTSVGAGGFLLGAPIVHWSHGHVGKGFISLGMRLGTPVLGALLLASSFSDRSGETSRVNSPMRFAAGLVLLVVWIPASISIDAAALAREEVPKSRVSFAPIIAPTRGGGTLGLGGTF